MLSDLQRVGEHIRRIQNFYELLQLQPSIKDGHLSYPSNEKRDSEMTEDTSGMQIEFR
jgi:hypothetical protein